MRNRRPSDSFTVEEKGLQPHHPRESKEIGGCGRFIDDAAKWVRRFLTDVKENNYIKGSRNTIRSDANI